MAQTIGFFRLIRVRTTRIASVLLHPARVHRKIEPFKSLARGFESPAGRYTRPLIVDWKLYVQRYVRMTKSYNLGHEFSMGRLLGVSAVLGSFLLRTRFAHCMDGYASSVDDHSTRILGESETDDNPHNFMIFAKKLMVPIALLLIVWMNWNYPVVLGVKIILTLLSTKPSPFSVYVFIEQLQQQYRVQHPVLHKFKSLYAKKVEVEDYTVFCVAKIEMGDHKYTLVGILGGWWVFELTSLRNSFSGFRSRTLEILQTAVSAYQVMLPYLMNITRTENLTRKAMAKTKGLFTKSSWEKRAVYVLVATVSLALVFTRLSRSFRGTISKNATCSL